MDGCIKAALELSASLNAITTRDRFCLTVEQYQGSHAEELMSVIGPTLPLGDSSKRK